MENGFYAALGTPTDENGRLLENSYAREIELMISAGTSGILCMGSMGKMESIRNSEYPEIARKCVEFAANRVPVMVGVMDCSAGRVLDRIDSLSNITIDGVVATAPFYSKVSPGSIINFFTQISIRSKYPVFVYDLPSVTQSPVDTEVLIQLMKIQNIKGIKTANMNMILDLIRNDKIHPGFSVFYSGLDSFDAAINAGIKKNLDGMFTCTPYNSKRMYQNIEEGFSQKISEHLRNILVLRNIFIKEDVLAAYSFAMELLNCPGNYHSDYINTVSDNLKESIYYCMKEIKEI